MDTGIEDRTAIITGGGSEIGRAIARVTAAAGWAVVAAGRDVTALEKTSQEVHRDGGRCVTVEVDLSEPGWARRLDRSPGAVDALIHAACPDRDFARVEAADPALARGQLEIGPLAALELVQRFLPGMRARRRGRIVLIGSAVAQLGGRGQAAYATAKASYAGLAASLAAEAGPDGITANVVAPGLIDTARTRGAVDDRVRSGLLDATPLRRAGTPAEVAAAVGFLLSDEAAFITGATLPVSGGLGLGLPTGERR